MAQVQLEDSLMEQLRKIDDEIRLLNHRKVKAFLEGLGAPYSPGDLDRLLEQPLLLVKVPTRSMALQLNRIVQYVPNLHFEGDAGCALFTIVPTNKGRRIWKKR